MDPKWFFGTMEQDFVLPAVAIPRPQSRVESPADAFDVDVAFFFLEEETTPCESLRHEGQNQSASSSSSSSFVAAVLASFAAASAPS